MKLVRLGSLIVLAAQAACTGDGVCGGGQHALARVVLPDTGLHAGAKVSLAFIQHDLQELSEVAVWQLWAVGTPPPPVSDVRVRIVRNDGLVLLDTARLEFRGGTPPDGQSGFSVVQWITTAESRKAWFDAFSANALAIELWRRDATGPTTRMQVVTQEAGVYPIGQCG